MATQQSIPQSIEQSKLAVVPFPASQPITQTELTLLLALRGRLHQLQEQVEQAESSIKARLESGVIPEVGDHAAELKENFRRNVAWREVCERIGDRLFGNGKGKPYCEKVLSATKPARTTSLIVR